MDDFGALRDRCLALGLKGMADAIEDIRRLSPSQRPGLTAGIKKLLEDETYVRENRKYERLFKRSKLKQRVFVKDVECSAERNLTQDQLDQISDCSFIRRGENLIITGQTGVGKSFLGDVLANEACLRGFKVSCQNMNLLIELIKKARAEGNYIEYSEELNQNDLLVIDEFGHIPFTSDALLLLLSLLDTRVKKKSIVLISQLPLDDIYGYFAQCSATTADAIMDRLRGTAMHINLTGASRRCFGKP